MHLRIGTRHSPLALWQAHWVADQLNSAGHQVELVKITTTGDTTTTPLGQGGGVGLFTKEIQKALLDERCDIAVHSLKDLPTQPIPGLTLAAVPNRESPNDCLISTKFRSLSDLPLNARIGTGSPRRKAQLLHLRPDLDLQDIRGNVETRLAKLTSQPFDAIILAYAGLQRLGLESLKLNPEHLCVLPTDVMLPAVGQAALGLETRTEDTKTREALLPLIDPATLICVRAERELLRLLQAGCLAPVAAHATIANQILLLRAKVFSDDGTKLISTLHQVPIDQSALSQADAINDETPISIAAHVAQSLKSLGAEELIASTRLNLPKA